jgi:hypothetical protein
MLRNCLVVAGLLLAASLLPAQEKAHAVWHAATAAELQAAIPARAPVEAERIETEISSASGISDGHGHVIAAVVLITAGYAAQGKYSHFLLAQAPLRLGNAINLAPGNYVIGWVRSNDGLLVHVYDAETGKDRGSVVARLQTPALTVVPVRIWPPGERSILQIGRFAVPYTLTE